MNDARPSPATILITGGAGFIGSHLAEMFLREGLRVSVLDNLSTGREENIAPFQAHPNFRFVRGEVTDEQAVQALADEAEVILHLAAAVGVRLVVEHPARCIETNVRGTEVVLKAALPRKRFVLVASSSEVYGKGLRIPFREDDDVLLGPTCRPRWAYAAGKMTAEFLALAAHREHGLPAIVFRLFNTVGPRQTGRYGMVVPRLVRQALRGKPLEVYGDGMQTRCFCDVRDVVAALNALVRRPDAAGGVFNIGGTKEISILQLAEKVKEVSGSASPIQLTPFSAVFPADFEDMGRRVPDVSRIKNLIGWSNKISLEETISAVVQFERRRVQAEND
jgi:UDP-glucose 4-epimerase